MKEKTPQWVLECSMEFTPTLQGMVNTKIPVYAIDRTLVTHPSQ